MEAKNCCGNCLNFLKISKQYGLCIITKTDIKNANTGGLNQVYMRVAKYNVCNGHFNLKEK